MIVLTPSGGFIKSIVVPHPTHGLGADATPAPATSLLDSPALPKVAMVISAYHGLRRNRGSLLWGLAWGVAGRLFPLMVPALAVAQGYAEEKRCP